MKAIIFTNKIRSEKHFVRVCTLQGLKKPENFYSSKESLSTIEDMWCNGKVTGILKALQRTINTKNNLYFSFRENELAELCMYLEHQAVYVNSNLCCCRWAAQLIWGKNYDSCHD